MSARTIIDSGGGTGIGRAIAARFAAAGDAGYRSQVASTLVGRAGQPTDVAAAVGYLASAEASWVTGQVLGVNGGAALGR